MTFKTIGEIARESLEAIKAAGSVRAAFGLSPSTGRVDLSRCECGGGCESLLECWFWYWMRKTDRAERGAWRQVPIGNYRVDCLIDCDGKQVVVELDGKEFHRDKVADLRRDDILMQSVDAIIRIPGRVMHWYPEATFCVLGAWFPRFKLRAVDTFCCQVHEFMQELRDVVHPDGDFPTQEKFVEWAEPNYELWAEREGIAWVGSPKAWLKRWNVEAPTLRGEPSRA